ncbi:helicase SNF2 [Pontibacillus halophilus JSM 076056 = DSM 19796]|uniref:Helicase SNF2 n=1 Tax=Pontibacillus halophilus JSM 076056 = DSM 19796 TaxID=1385510 RepID=A0A0A5GPZ5_9BACI|nr:DEAD/DEAH box helicase [Pontibacillus halophilus]KGX94009.1 helicase SNF2 [Pontibacillus halophilus JSM 076056 = DSM 19796]
MIDLTAPEVLELSGWTVYKRGESYYDAGAVTRYSRYTTSDQLHTRIFAEVAGSPNQYEVQLTFANQSGAYMHGQCTCPAFQEGMSVCKHMVAALLETIKRYTDNQTPGARRATLKGNEPSQQELQKASTFVDTLLEQVTESENNYVQEETEPLHLQFELEGVFTRFSKPSDLELSIKAGTSKLYVVKDPAQFVDAWYNGEPLYFTSKFTYEPDTQLINEDDARVLEFLYPIIKSQQYFSESDLYLRSAKKNIQLPNHFLSQLFPLLEECDSVVLKGQMEDVPLHIEQNHFPESFRLASDNRHYSLTIVDNGFLSEQIADTPYFVKKNQLYKVSRDIAQSVIPLYNHLAEQPERTQVLEQDHVEQLAGTVFPVLEEHELLVIEDDITSNLKRYECEPKLHLQEEDHVLMANLTFHYGEEVIDPFRPSQRQSNQVITRNMKVERQLMDLITQANFHWNGSVLSLRGSEDLGRFFYVILPELEKQAEITMSDGVQDMYGELPEEVPLALDVDENYGWFEVRFPTEDLSDDQITSLFQSLKERASYHQLDNGRVVDLNEDNWEHIRKLFDQLDLDPEAFEGGVMHLPKYRALQVDTSAGVQQSEAFMKLIEAVKHPETLQEEPPEALQATMRDYQLRGFQWLRSLSRHGFGGVLADEMGLGKTLQSLAYILASRLERPDAEPFLVVTPASLIYNWEQEAAKFTPTLNVRIVSGTKEARRKQLEDLSNVDMIITSYPIMRRDVDLYQSHFFQGMLLDEAQSFKNHTSLTYKSVRTIRAETAFALTGTPVENRAEELWSLFSIVMPGLLYDRQSFKGLSQPLIQRKISPFVLRRTKKNVLTELPDKIQTVRYTDLTKEQRELYVGYLREIQQQTKRQLATGTFQQNRMQILSNLTRLRQLCCHPGLFVEDYEGQSGKLEELRTFVREAHENGQRLLIFSQFTSMLDLIADMVKEEGLTYFYLDGETPAQDRVTMATRFNEGENDLFLISLKAGGTGLNLVGADTVVLYDLWWNPAVEQQAADRAHRIGQKKSVQVVKMIAKGTIEEKIQSLQEQKQNLFDTLIQSGEGNLSALTEDDIRDILSI